MQRMRLYKRELSMLYETHSFAIMFLDIDRPNGNWILFQHRIYQQSSQTTPHALEMVTAILSHILMDRTYFWRRFISVKSFASVIWSILFSGKHRNLIEINMAAIPPGTTWMSGRRLDNDIRRDCFSPNIMRTVEGFTQLKSELVGFSLDIC